LVARFAQVRVEVDEAGDDDGACAIQDPLCVEAGTDTGDPSVFDQHIGRPVAENLAPLEDDAHGAPPRRSVNKTAMRTATPLATCSVMTAFGSAATSGVISTPRTMGPGCMIRAFSGSRRARRPSSPYRAAYSRKLGRRGPVPRSICTRNM